MRFSSSKFRNRPQKWRQATVVVLFVKPDFPGFHLGAPSIFFRV